MIETRIAQEYSYLREAAIPFFLTYSSFWYKNWAVSIKSHTGGNGADADMFEFGLKPGLKLNLSNHVSFVTKVGFFGYQKNDFTDTQKWGMDVDATNVTFGVNYKF